MELGLVGRALRLSAAATAGIAAGILLPDMPRLDRYGIDGSRAQAIDACPVAVAMAVILVSYRGRSGPPDTVVGMAGLSAAAVAAIAWAVNVAQPHGQSWFIGEAVAVTGVHGLKGFLTGLVVWIVACLPFRSDVASGPPPPTTRVVLAFVVAPSLVGAAMAMLGEDAPTGSSIVLIAASVLVCGVPAYLVVVRFSRVTFATCAGGAAFAGCAFAVGLIVAVEGIGALRERIAVELVLLSSGHAFLAGCLFWVIAVADWSSIAKRTGR